MHFERIDTEGLSAFSYLVGDAGKAAVIDPRRDCETYIDKARNAGLEIVYVLETHRHEDLVVGSVQLAARTEAEVWHADGHLAYGYGQPLRDGQQFQIGGLRLEAIASPGHTPGSMSYVLFERSGDPWILFSGDTLLAGAVGRTDLSGDAAVGSLTLSLHQTLFERLLPLGDEVLVCPAHGAGTVCGRNVASRPWTTIGIEKKLNLSLSLTSSDDFLAANARVYERPPYFAQVERVNLEGAAPLPLPVSGVVSPRAFAEAAAECQVVDARTELEFGAAHVPGSLSLWERVLPRYAGWFVDHERPILLVLNADDPTGVVTHLQRLGYDQVAGTLAGGMRSWHMRGLESRSLIMLSAQRLCEELDFGGQPFLLDVRSDEEFEEDGRVTGAYHLPLTQLPGRVGELPRGRAIYVICRSGVRATTAASLLEQAGWSDIGVIMGGAQGWRSARCAVERSWSTASEQELTSDGG